MKRKPDEKVRGTARVTFIAHLNTIKAELAQGWTARAVYDRLGDKIAELISYPQFVRYARQLREVEPASPIGRPSPPKVQAPSAPPSATAGPTPLLTASQGSPRPTPPSQELGTPDDAGRKPARTFTYNGNPDPELEDRLIGGSRRRTEG